MTRIFYYKLTNDSGAAPCVDDHLLSLAICKPKIRVKATEGDLIFGFAANSLSGDNRLIYVACVTEKMCNGQYYTDKRFAGREDRIYRYRDGGFEWYRGVHGRNGDLERDLGRASSGYPGAQVLLSKDFRYFGANGTADYKARFLRIKKAVQMLGQGHRVNLSEELRGDFLALKRHEWRRNRRRVQGRPTSKPSPLASYRGGSCGVLE